MTPSLRSILSAGFLTALSCAANSQHLVWKYRPSTAGYTCLYGEVEVLATGPTIYYCGCNWWPGNPAGGYTGIQDQGDGRHNMIFSIWDTAKDLHPEIIGQESRTLGSRFGGEGEGAHTHLDYGWRVGNTYRFYAVKRQNATGDRTLCTVYFYDDGLWKWVDEATIASPYDWHESVRTFGGMLNSFLENWSGQHKERPKLALYRLWVGTSPDDLTNVTEARGDGKWGVLNGAFYLAEGDDNAVAALLKRCARNRLPVVAGPPNRSSLTVPAQQLPGTVVRELDQLPG